MQTLCKVVHMTKLLLMKLYVHTHTSTHTNNLRSTVPMDIALAILVRNLNLAFLQCRLHLLLTATHMRVLEHAPRHAFDLVLVVLVLTQGN